MNPKHKPGNHFRNRVMRAQYDGAVKAFEMKHRDLFLPDGTPRRTSNMTIGSSFASYFWHGYNGTLIGRGFTDAASREMLGYAIYRAGQDCAAKETA